ncbi:AAA family ATPase [Massilia sp. MB5]|uniref:ExeA family protein n=1 Tax=Massilia sp. MB5 TaxID=2919578 RepID=UPI001F0EB7ED|nr:AAA family ATPase [Massilia sp. MB5]UMR29082.1 AAA family ATPase [Massilia sp. MB5]
MYQSHFGLNQAPFNITPNPAFFYSGNERGAMLGALLYAVGSGEGIIKVTGEVGSGKTMLCRMLDSQLPPHVDVIYLVNPSLGPEEVLYAIAGELGLNAEGLRGNEVLRLLNADLIARHSAGRQVLLLVEEAQAMPLETLEEVRLLTNLETAHHKLLQIVLFGQPELDESLALPRMRQLRERITHSFTVPPLAPELLPDFLAFRLQAAGHHGRPLFSKGAVKLIARVSQGIVRRVNILADKALMAAFADDAATVRPAHVRQAIRDSSFAAPPRALPAWLLFGAGFVLALLVAGAWLVWQQSLAPPDGYGKGRPAARLQAGPASRFAG